MEKNNCKNLIRELINKVYNSTDLTNELLDEIQEDIEKMNEFISKKAPYRELVVLIEGAKKQKNMAIRQNYKYTILSNLEKRYRKLEDSDVLASKIIA